VKRFIKPQKIDLEEEYPCPCPRKKGKLVPMFLMEAMGCDRCQQIFAVEQEGYLLEQVSSAYPYKRFYQWTGHRWMGINENVPESYIPLVLCIMLIVMLTLFCLTLLMKTGTNMLLAGIVPIFMALLPMLMVWLAYRRY
jgi:hypothetical protein